MQRSLLLCCLLGSFSAVVGRSPGQILNLSGWQLQTCLASPRAVDGKALTTYSDENFYSLNENGTSSIMFKTPDNASAVTTHSSHPRTELRDISVEDWPIGNTIPAIHVLTAKCVVMKVSSTNGETIIAQIHGSVNEERAKVVKLRWNKGLLEARVKNASFAEFGLNCGTYSLGEELEYTVKMNASQLTVSVNGKVCGGSSYSPPYNPTDRYYFKAGDYNQCSPCSGAGMAEVRFSAISTAHTHSSARSAVVNGAFPSAKYYACQPPAPSSQAPWCDMKQAIGNRSAALAAAMNATELVRYVLGGAVGRLGVPAPPHYGAESLHAVAVGNCPFPDRCTTIFPPASGSARSFNRTLWRAIGAAMGLEARTLWNTKGGVLSLRGPQLNLQRDPRWGRNSNSPSEDPRLCGVFGAELTLGMQNGAPVDADADTDGPNNFLLTAAEMKHFAAYGVKSNSEANRFAFDANISLHDMADSYLVPMKIAVERANISAAMCSYSAINGTPSCANEWMNGQVLRSAWGWDGLIESDCGALTNIQTRFHYSKDGPGTAAAAMRGTCDVECDTVYKNYLAKALASGDLDLQHVRESVRRLLKHRMKLGLFDPIDDQMVTKLTDPSVIHGPVHVQLAHEAAVQSIVLLQHPEGILPLDSTTPGKTLAVIGPLANLTDAFIGDYAAKACPGSAPVGFGNKSDAVKTATWCLRTALQEITKAHAGGETTFAAGCDDPKCANEDNATAVATASAADTIVMLLGLVTTRVPYQGGPGNTNSESNDRRTIGLPGRQAALAEAVIAVGKPTILVVVGGGSVSVDFAKGKPHVAVVAAGFGGEAGASGLSSVLFGESNPSARLAATIYNQADFTATCGTAHCMNNMSMQAGSGRSYRYLQTTPSWPFGAGMSFTSFSISIIPHHSPTSPGPSAAVGASTGVNSNNDLLTPFKLAPTGTVVSLGLKVKNTGSRAGANVATVFATWAGGELPVGFSVTPLRWMVSFGKTEDLEPGGSVELDLSFPREELKLVNSAGDEVVLAGKYAITVFDGTTTLPPVTVTISESTVVSKLPPPPSNHV
jgi:beta-glucosidase-like glycosyl hydrolase